MRLNAMKVLLKIDVDLNTNISTMSPTPLADMQDLARDILFEWDNFKTDAGCIYSGLTKWTYIGETLVSLVLLDYTTIFYLQLDFLFNTVIFEIH